MQMDLGHVIRPVVFTTGYEPCAAAFFGSGFLVRSTTDFYFVTARHVLKNHGKLISDLRILAKLGCHDVIPQLRGIHADIGRNNSFEDLLVIHLDGAYVREHKLENQFWPIQRRDGFIAVGQTAVALGFPEEEQEVDVESNKGSYRPVYIKGTISEVDPEERMIVVETPSTIPLKSFNQMSGGAVFAFDPELSQDIVLAGVILQGGRSANILRPLGAICIFNLITHFEADELGRKHALQPQK